MEEATHEGQLVRQHHPNLVIRISSLEGSKYQVQRVGEEDGRTIRCTSAYVSRKHCEIFRKDRAYWIKDLQSSNGTYLNGIKLKPHHDRELRFGDIIGLGISHEPSKESILPSDVECFIFKFCKREEVELEVIDLEDEEETQAVDPPSKNNEPLSNVQTNPDSDEDIQFVVEVEVSKSNQSTSSSSPSPTKKKVMPPPPPPPIISDRASLPSYKQTISAAEPHSTSSLLSKSQKQQTMASASGIKANDNDATNNKRTKSTDLSPKHPVEEGTNKRHLETEKQEPPAKRRKPNRISSSSSDDSSDGLGEEVEASKSSKKVKSKKNSTYSGVSSDESSSDESKDKHGRRTASWVNSPTEKQDGRSRNNVDFSDAASKVSSSVHQSYSSNEEMSDGADYHEPNLRRKYDELKEKALRSVCKVKLKQIIEFNKQASKFLLTREGFDIVNPKCRSTLKEQFAASLNRNRLRVNAPDLLENGNAFRKVDQSNRASISSESDDEDAESNKRVCKRDLKDRNSALPRDTGSSTSVENHLLVRDDDNDNDEMETSYEGKAPETPGTIKSKPLQRGIQLLNDPPLPRFAARAQSRSAPFKQPKPPTTPVHQRIPALGRTMSEESLPSPPTSPTYQSFSKEEQKNMRLQKLREIELSKQQERESATPSPRRFAQPKVKCTNRNRNQGLVDTMLGTESSEPQQIRTSTQAQQTTRNIPDVTATSITEKQNPASTSAHWGLSDPRLLRRENSHVIPSDPRVKQNSVPNNNGPHLRHDGREIVMPTSRRPTAPSFLKPGAEVILSPPAANRVHYKEVGKPSSSDSSKHIPPHIPEDDIQRRILNWRPVWMEEQHTLKLKTDPPILTDLTLTRTVIQYDSFKAYFKIYYPLLLSELWATIAADYGSNSSHHRGGPERRYEYQIKIDEIRREFGMPFCKKRKEHDRPVEEDCVYIRYHTWVRKHGEMDERRNLVVLTLNGTQKEVDSKQAKAEKKLFAIPSPGTERYEQITKKTDCDPRLKKDKGNIMGYRFSEVLVCKFGKHFVVDKSELGRVNRICTITPKLREFKALNTMQQLPLFKQIVTPCKDPKNSWQEWKNNQFSTKAPDMISFCQQLNLEQKAIIQRVSRKITLSEPEIMLIHGPPGTGKTTTIVGLVLQVLLSHRKHVPGKNHRILICTPSNAAIDEIIRRLNVALQALPKTSNDVKAISLVRIGEGYAKDVQKYTVDAKVEEMNAEDSSANNLLLEIECINGDILKLQENMERLRGPNNTIALQSKQAELNKLILAKKECQSDYDNLMNHNKTSKEVAQQKRSMVIRKSQIICTTLCSSSASLMKAAFMGHTHGKPNAEDKPFLCCVVDEATQTTEPETLLPLVYNVNKLILVGDPHQLGATVLSNTAEEKNYGQSLFARHFKYHARHNENSSPVMTLIRQYRMHPEIIKWPNEYFYDGKLQNMYKKAGSNYSLRPYYFLNVSSGREHSEKEGQIQNEDEVIMVKALIETIDELLKPVGKKWTIGVITPYAAQKQSIKNAFHDKTFSSFEKVEVDTVDGFQGQEKDIILLSCVRTDGTGFLKSGNRLNVALTRAKHSLYIIGDAQCLSKEEMWRCLIQDAAKCSNKYDVNHNFRYDLKLLKNQLCKNLKINETNKTV